MNTETGKKPDTAAALAACAAGIAYRAAQAWLTRNNKTADPDALAACVLSWTRAEVGRALLDARDAIRANMEQAAVMTFQASMALAGIEAAKEADQARGDIETLANVPYDQPLNDYEQAALAREMLREERQAAR